MATFLRRSLAFQTDTGNVVFCIGLLLLVARLVTFTVGMGINDDWSYIRTAREVAVTGHLHYNGWGEPMLGPQSYWAALFIKIFGFSLGIARLSSIVLTCVFTPVVYGVPRRVGLTPGDALLCTLAVLLSPLFLPNFPTLMTEASSFVFFMATLYCSVEAWEARRTRSFIAWSLGGIFFSVLAATTRQIFWWAGLSFLATILLFRWREWRIRTVLAVELATILGLAVAVRDWLRLQPYWANDNALYALQRISIPDLARSGVRSLGLIAGTMLIFSGPAVVAYIGPWIRRQRWWITGIAALICAALACAIANSHLWLGNMVTEYGVFFADQEALGRRPVILGFWWIAGIYWICLLGCVAILGTVLGAFAARFRLLPGWATESRIGRFVTLAIPFAAGYDGALLFRSLTPPIFDRYLLPLLPLIAIPLVWLHRRRFRRSSVASWCCVAVYGLFGLSTTHDLFASATARKQALDLLQAHGISRSEILVGFDSDCAAEIDLAGYVNSIRIHRPPDAYRRVRCDWPAPVSAWWSKFNPEIHPRYFVSFSRLPGLVEMQGFVPVEYRTWLPWTVQKIYVLQFPDQAEVACR